MITGEIGKGEESLTGPELTLTKGTTQAFVRPSEGAIVSRFRVEDTDVLFQDQFVQTNKGPRRRGGNPILFPNAGPLPKENEVFPNLPQHGFARDKAWKIKDISADGDFAILALTSDEETKTLFSYDFELELRISVDNGKLTQELSVTNHSEAAMPVAPGFHPYFLVPIEKRGEIITNIFGFNPREFDWNSSLDFSRQVFVSLEVPGSGEISIESSDEFQKLIVWSEPERPHLCIEPWTRGVGAIINPQERIEIQAGKTANFSIEIGFQKTPS